MISVNGQTDPPTPLAQSRSANEENEERAIEPTANCSGLQGAADLRGLLQSDSRNLPPKPESQSVSQSFCQSALSLSLGRVNA